MIVAHFLSEQVLGILELPDAIPIGTHVTGAIPAMFLDSEAPTASPRTGPGASRASPAALRAMV